MSGLVVAVTVLVAVLHVGFAVLEGVLWSGPVGRQVFGMSTEQAAQTRVLALNQAVYNLFLAAGLVLALVRDDPAVLAFVLACVLVAGVVGGLTASRRILWLQALPAAVGLVLLAVA